MVEVIRLPSVAAVVPTYNRREKTLRFLTIALTQTYPRLTVIVVDAASADGTAEAVQQQFPQVVLLTTSDRDYWSATVNVGVRYALTHGFDYILTIYDDSVIEPDHLERLVALAERRQLKILGNRIDYLAQPGQIWALGTYIRWGTQDFLGWPTVIPTSGICRWRCGGRMRSRQTPYPVMAS
ncbi:glycosyltransferase family 2 protein [Romeria aff. gracilis LEGE 07310]|uniref:Glycosyltransferase family 2 protein n=1 Tax=Vasconcelosia minhoensis LEGE 07310 TaxID=915328 RepID=A0A8J7AIZ1_9CYAN|nr:glycosyltransferase [Romeria gracilis]MBE9079946.1 glycosyltransferase family 2 protein [Romeria aff. gracilis LEGE 07310]